MLNASVRKLKRELSGVLQIWAAGALVLTSMVPLLAPAPAHAAQLQQVFVRLDRMSSVTATGGRVCIKPQTSSTPASVAVTFPTTTGLATDFSLNTTPGNWTTNTSNLDSGQTAWTTLSPSTVSGKTVTWTNTMALTAGTLYCFNFASSNTLTTSSAYASTASEATHGTVATSSDSGTYALYILGANGDQVSISNAVVPPAFSFVLNGTTDSFTTNLTSGAVATTAGGRTITINTNAENGWIVWVKDANDNGGGKGSLRSANAGNYNIPGNKAVGAASLAASAGTEDYGVGVTLNAHTGTGSSSPDAAYDGGGTGKIGTLDPVNFKPLASCSGTSSNDVLTLTWKAAVSGTTPAATDYADTTTFVGAGRF